MLKDYVMKQVPMIQFNTIPYTIASYVEIVYMRKY